LVQDAVRSGSLSLGAGANLERWLNEPQYADYGQPIAQLVQQGDWARLDRLFWEVIPFGTGGRRGLMAEFGSATINPRTIAESADGLARYLASLGIEGPKAVIAHDTRNRSQEFARLTAAVLAGNGFKV